MKRHWGYERSGKIVRATVREKGDFDRTFCLCVSVFLFEAGSFDLEIHLLGFIMLWILSTSFILFCFFQWFLYHALCIFAGDQGKSDVYGGP